MGEELVQPAEVTTANLKDWFDAAFFDTWIDDAGHLHLRDGFDCYVVPHNDGMQIRLAAAFQTSAAASRDAIFDYANRVNNTKIIIRATVRDDRAILFDYYLSIEGGTPRRNIVITTRRWMDILKGALQLDTDKVLDIAG